MRGGGAGGGCAVRATVFARAPITSGIGLSSGSDQFATVAGLASDDVARIVAFLAGGQTMPVPLRDNVFVVDIARSRLPARLVAYDRERQVIGFTQTFGDDSGPGSARGHARLLLHGVSPTGATAALSVGGSTGGGNCMYLHLYESKYVQGTMVSCAGRTWRGPPLQLTGSSQGFVAGRVRGDVATLVVRFADGGHATVAPTDGFVLYTIPRRHLAPGHQAVAAVGRNAAGDTVGTQPFPPPRKR
jgi:hypothetical protein